MPSQTMLPVPTDGGDTAPNYLRNIGDHLHLSLCFLFAQAANCLTGTMGTLLIA